MPKSSCKGEAEAKDKEISKETTLNVMVSLSLSILISGSLPLTLQTDDY